jgi:branched-chain amino acid transport system ATP-binding protein
MSNPVISIRNLTKKFGAIIASDNLNIELREGEIHALIGPNGAGKSTLIGQICGTLKPDAGSIHLCNEDVNQLKPSERAKAGLARSFQISSAITNFTALENVLLSVQGNAGGTFSFFTPFMKDESHVELARSYLTELDLLDRQNVQTSTLSHGERRRLELAVALALEPKAFLLDEPMAGLGIEGVQGMIALLSKLKHKAPIFLVEHDMDAVFALADRISVLVSGKIIATGDKDTIQNNAEVRKAYLGDDDR